MRTITITYSDELGYGWDVHEDGKCCNGLSWDEMLGQVAMLTIPASRVGNGFQMLTPDEWKERKARIFGNRPVQAVPPLLLPAPVSQ